MTNKPSSGSGGGKPPTPPPPSPTTSAKAGTPRPVVQTNTTSTKKRWIPARTAESALAALDVVIGELLSDSRDHVQERITTFNPTLSERVIAAARKADCGSRKPLGPISPRRCSYEQTRATRGGTSNRSEGDH